MGMVEWLQDLNFNCRRRLALRARSRFYHLLLKMLSDPPDRVGILFGQGSLFVPPATDYLLEPEYGTLYVNVYAEFHGISCHHAWSIYQTGERLRIAVILFGALERAPLIDWQREMADMWPGVEHKQLVREEFTLYEWSFQSRAVYTDYVAQESFALNMRHCHFRMLRIIRDFALLQAEAEGRPATLALPVQGVAF